MKFQSVRISGFKSFLEPTQIELTHGLTGIVGPNGCGKSNVIEAIKWVMGENSARQMRGDGMDDIIFAGTDTRPPRNFAEVLLKLDNTEKKLPSAFNHLSEIEISRKIERDKGSIYRVNGKVVRARDVQLIFADSGTGARSSGIVGQGRIAQIIDASPENRRMILEEAANIKGLHSRRHEAELKLNSASDNLERLFDIEKTLKNQLIDLEKQGRQAARYRSIGDRLRKGEATLFFKLLEEAREEYESLKKELNVISQNVEQASLEVKENTKNKLIFLDQIPSLRNSEADKSAILQSLNITKIRLEDEQNSTRIGLKNVTNQVEELEIDIHRETEIQEDALTSLKKLSIEKDKLERDSESFLDKILQSTKIIKELRDKSDQADLRLASITSEILTIKSDVSELEKKIQNLKEKIQNTYSQIISFKQEDDEKNLKLNQNKAKDITKSVSENKKNIESFKQELDKLETSESTLIASKNIELNNLNQINAEINTLSSLLGGDTLNKNTLEKSINFVEKFEDAIGSVLGETLLAPIYPDDEIISNTTYWRDGFDTKVSLPLPQEASPLINKIKNSSLLEIALQGVGIVESEEVAYRLQKKLSYGQALTTAEGGLWRWDGFVQPKGVKNSYSERLQQIAKLKNLKIKLPVQEEKVSLIDNKLSQSSFSIKNLKNDIVKSENELNELIANFSKLELENSKIEAKLTSSMILVQELKNSEIINKKELVELEKQKTNIINLPILLADELTIRNNAIQCRSDLTEAMAQEQQIKNQENFQLRNIAQINNQQESWNKRNQEALQRLKLLKERLISSIKEKERLSTLPNVFIRKEKEIIDKIEEAVLNRDKAADQLVACETSLNQAEKLEKDAGKALSLFRENMIRKQALLDLSNTKISNLQERVFERLRIQTDQLFALTGLKENEELNTSIDILEKTVERLIRERESLGTVNLRAEEEMNEMNNKIELMIKDRLDLEEAIKKLRNGIFELNKEGRERLEKSFELVNKNFKKLFEELFGGGSAELKLVGNEDPLQAGLEVLASPPGKKMQLLSLLSGGEQALTAISLIFSVFLCNPSPICILDEVDASLDDTNVGRFCELLNKISYETSTYFMVITHHRLTMAKMDRLFGITMEQKGISKLVSVDLEQASRIRNIA